MKIALIIILAIAIFMFFSTRNSKSKEEWAEKQKVSKEKFNELVKDSNREEVLWLYTKSGAWKKFQPRISIFICKKTNIQYN